MAGRNMRTLVVDLTKLSLSLLTPELAVLLKAEFNASR